MQSSETKVDVYRRAFLKELGSWSLGVLLGGFALSGRAAPFRASGFARPALPGACLMPVGDVERTLAAVLDTVVPGRSSDPSGDPGALEACAMNLLLDDHYPFRTFAPMFAAVFDQMSEETHGQAFADLPYESRLDIVIEAQDRIPLLTLAYRAIRSAFYGGAYNGVGLTWLGYPGPNLGYRHLPEASFRRPVCRERTETGWMP